MARLEAFGTRDEVCSVTSGPAAVGLTSLRSPGRAEPHFLYRPTKRLLDLGLSLLLLAPALAVLAFASLAIVLSTRQNPLFLQERVGLHGRTFPMLKLRTMSPGRNAGNDGGSASDGLWTKTPLDPRVTPIGRLLRRTSIDELPQLLNVVFGQMSLVGPRPALPIEVAQYPSSWHRGLQVKPGLTGLWQVCGRSELTPQRRAVLDRYYLRRRSLAFDALILLRTIGAIISMRGAW